jgi:hypothetical protein
MVAQTEGGLRWVPLVPVVIACSLAGIYALGAISIFGQFLAANLDGAQTMPLVPIDQILARGIGAIIDQAVWGVLGISAAYSISTIEDLKEAKARREGQVPSVPDPSGGAGGQIFTGRLGIGMWIALLVAAFFVPFGLVSTIGAGLLTIQSVIPRVRDWMLRQGYEKWRPTAFLASYCAFLVVSAVVGAFTRPSPLPDIRLERSAGKSIHGGLVAANGSNWFVAKPDGMVLSVPGGVVDIATITYSEESDDESLFQRVR